MSLSESVYDHLDDALRSKVSDWLSQPPAHFVDGTRREPRAGASMPVLDPGTGRPIGAIAAGDAADVADAVASSVSAFDQWRSLRPSKRADLIHRAGSAIRANLDELSVLETLDTGKPRKDASGEGWWASDAFHYYAGQATLVDGRTTQPMGGVLAATVREPVGVCAAVTAWNFPMILAGFKIPAALACGNAIVVKPAEQASLSTLRIAALVVEAGLPAGLVNVVSGTGESAGAALVEHDDVRAVTFTGSTPVGRQVGAVAGRRLVRSTLELGGKSAQVVFADTDLDQAGPPLLRGIYQNAGQMCGAGSRIVAHVDIVEPLCDRLKALAADLVIGHGLDPATTFGPLITAEQHERVKGYVDQAVTDGARVVFGGGDVPTGLGGHFFAPTMLADLAGDHPAAAEEIFGPVVVLQTFTTADEAVHIANSTPYGLAASVWSGHTETAFRVAQRLIAGNIWVNGYGIVHPSVPFGGFGDSGVGRDLGPGHLDFYTEEKTIWLGLDGKSI